MMAMLGQSVVKRNIFANVLGGSWAILLNVVAIPFQAKILGAEDYGVLGFGASLQVALTVLDFGLSTTVIREIASDRSPDHRDSRELIQTVGTVYWLIAMVLGLGLALTASRIVHSWFKLEAMTPRYATVAIQIMSGWVAFTWPVTLYASVLSGLQRLEVVNALRVLTNTINLGGGVIVLLVSGDLHVFLMWMAVNAFLAVSLHVMVCRRLLPGISLGLHFSPEAIKRIWRFSLDMNVTSALGILYTQSDRILIGNLLSLKALGYYNAAYNLTKGIGTVQGFFGSAILPTLASDYSLGQKDALRTRYSKYAQFLVYLAALPTSVLVFFGHDLLLIWTTPETAAGAYRALGILAVGFLLNAAMSAPYVLSIATGHTRIPLLVNVIAVPFYLPGLYFLIVRYGIDGAALAWPLLNLYYVATFLPLTQRKIVKARVTVWFCKNLLPFLGLGSLFWIGRTAISTLQLNESPSSIWAACVSSTVGYLALGYLFLDSAIRKDIQSAFRRIRVALKQHWVRCA